MGLEAPQFCLVWSLANPRPLYSQKRFRVRKKRFWCSGDKKMTKLPDFPDQMPESPFHLKCADPRVDRGRGSEIQRDPVQSDPRISLLGEGHNKERRRYKIVKYSV